ncbi:hypothetical protein CBF34_10615 [Vagococcus penaei]|uniref:Rqc2 homolog RqcH n=1 Tax=Vagococcus penaei TaxID=633807 RepID=A0A1Q2D3E4_9ENTE|nr:NFACT RNA binding domain-containing protein [Vagococcus penaei]AQP52853.1 hypothetical protein BW732_00525 [Vagococcus penaei]RST98178.1 hypothetical protein CBF34_10615 [Vagococcus penaei]
MSYDGILTHFMVNELQQTIINGRLSKIHQPYDHEIMLVFRNNGKNHTLLLSAHPSYARVQLTTITYKNPMTPPNFCMILRKYLEGSILTAITQIDNDRIIHLSFSSRNELGDLEEIVLVVELMGRHSNIILLNKQTHKIIDTIKHIGSSQNTYRLLLPGATYINPPTTNQLNPFNVSTNRLFELMHTSDEITVSQIMTTFQGIGRDTANEIVYRMKQSPKDKLKQWQQFFDDLMTHLKPTLTTCDGKDYLLPIPFQSIVGNSISFNTLSQLLDYFYEGKAERDRVKQQAGELIRKVSNDQEKIKKKLKKLEQSLIDADNAEIFRIKGELLTTYLHDVPRGVPEITLANYYEENEPITITLNMALSPNQNAQKYFQRYQKLKNGVKIVKEQISIAKFDLIYLESVLSQLEIASPKDIDMIREELIEEKYIKPKRQELKKKKHAKSKPEEFKASDGTTILVGRNNLQNDLLTLKQAKKTDFWLHAKDIPGSHVIVKSDKPSEQTLLEAAELAAYYSKYRLSSHVPVDYVQVKHIKKPNGAKPGYVIYDNQKTLSVTPTKKMVDDLRETK